MKTTLFITRHGQTLWNTQKRMQGGRIRHLLSWALNKPSRWVKEMANTNIDYIYTSPIGRAFKTAEIVRGCRDIKMIKDDRIREINMGIWEGMSQEEIDNLYKEQLFNFWNAPHLYKPLGGESFMQVKQRTQNFIEQIVKENKGKVVLIVTHTVALKSIMSYINDISLERLWSPPYIHPTSLTKVEIKDNVRKL